MAGDILDEIPTDACPECSTVLQDFGCRNCGWVRPRDPEIEAELRKRPYPHEANEGRGIGGF